MFVNPAIYDDARKVIEEGKGKGPFNLERFTLCVCEKGCIPEKYHYNVSDIVVDNKTYTIYTV